MMPHTYSALQVNQLHKSFSQKPVLQDVSLQVAAGEVLAILGPNGAGKTTLIAAILGLLTTDSGDITLLGQRQQGNKRSAALRQQLGVMMQIGSLSANLTVFEQCDLFSSYYANGYSAAELVSLAGLEMQTNQRFGRLSGGQKQRLLFALALAGKPQLVFLDEPTLGMDVQARRSLWQQVRQLKQQGVAVVLTTHYLEEAEELCDRIAIINHGQLIANKPTRELVDMAREKIVTVTTAQDLAAAPAHEAFVKVQWDGARGVEVTYDKDRLSAGQVLGILQDQGVRVEDVTTREADLEDVFVQLTAGAG